MVGISVGSRNHRSPEASLAAANWLYDNQTKSFRNLAELSDPVEAVASGSAVADTRDVTEVEGAAAVASPNAVVEGGPTEASAQPASAPPPAQDPGVLPGGESMNAKIERIIQSLKEARQTLIRDFYPEFTNAEGELNKMGELSESIDDLHKAMNLNPWGNFVKASTMWLKKPASRVYEEHGNFNLEFPSMNNKAAQEVASRHYRIDTIAAYPMGILTPVQYINVQTAPGVTERLPSLATYFLEDSEGRRLIVTVSDHDLTVACDMEHREVAQTFMARVQKWSKEDNFYRNNILTYANLQFQLTSSLPSESVDWDAWIAPPKTKESLQKEIEGFFRNWRALARNGGNTFKGILLYGPPGVGKSYLNRILFSQLKDRVTFIHVTAKSIKYEIDMVKIFEAARRLRPAIIILEDLDLIGIGNRDNTYSNGALNEMLNQMSGVMDNTGIIVLASSNRLNIFDGALLRSGRFSPIVPLKPPETPQRLALLKILTRQLIIRGPVDLDQIAQQTAGWTGADLAYLITRVIDHAVTSGSLEGEIAVLEPPHFESALAEIREFKKRARRDQGGEWTSDAQDQDRIGFRQPH